jgi:hypothetical protein
MLRSEDLERIIRVFNRMNPGPYSFGSNHIEDARPRRIARIGQAGATERMNQEFGRTRAGKEILFN